ncbi:MgtC/SapB family protein [Ancylobacter sp. TS-1]|uniref:MgtC/SapB family protein n=1 Tax=Ancylobacter sp. TS-1 TaxID=1850374 RepID=UPI001265B614|nr:MgtC/SapB family protein [Ancylobacter sp. TS-1]QFR31790.1 MgtC/SapB family protein [Ancylobacter sp. TS-1]
MVLDGVDLDNLLRLLAATLIGMAVGTDRDLKGKPGGMRTLGPVCMGATLVSLTALQVGELNQHPDATSRVVQGVLQGVLTGVGFIGAGVVLRSEADGHEAHRLTTAATVWATAVLGIACALASWNLILLGLVFTVVLLVVANPLERIVERLAARRAASRNEEAGPDADR